MCLQLASASTSNRFNLQQRAILNSHYRMGMVGTGKVHSFRHEKVAAEIGCSVDKIKACVTIVNCNSVYQHFYMFRDG